MICPTCGSMNIEKINFRNSIIKGRDPISAVAYDCLKCKRIKVELVESQRGINNALKNAFKRFMEL